MSNQKMLVNVQEGETRIALIENNKLVDLHIEQTSNERTVGNIYRGVVVKVNPAFQAAFVEYGEKKNGFLSISDVNPVVFGGEGGRRPYSKIQSIVKPGQTVMVQVLKEGVGAKGAALTTFVSLPGRYLVLSPNSDRSGVSRKIEDTDKRAPLKEILSGLVGTEKIGLIIRTAGLDRSPADLKKDLAALQKEWKKIESVFQKEKRPGLLYREASSLLRVLRDYFSENVDEVWVDSATAFQHALTYFKTTLPRFQKRLQFYVGDKSLFSAHNIEPQIEALDSNRVPLRSGGGIVIEPTEALVSIDVNSGKSNQASDVETTALNTNLEAAEEVARQLRLRNLGGLIVIDFIDMMQAKNRAKVKQVLDEGLKNDKARTTLGSISSFGLLELTRQRIDSELSRGSREKCAHCGGTGFVPTENASGNNVLRRIRELAATGNYSVIQGELPLDHANFLLNERRESLRDLEQEFDIFISLRGNPGMPNGAAIRISGEKEDSSIQETEPMVSRAEVRTQPEPRPQPEPRTQPEPRPQTEPRTQPAVKAETEAEEEGGGRSRRRRRGRGRGGAGREMEHSRVEEHQEEQKTEAAFQQEEPEEVEKISPERSPVAPPGRTPQVRAADNGKAPSSQGIAALPAAPVGRTVAPTFGGRSSTKRGGWLATIGGDAPIGETLFNSAHKPAKAGQDIVVQSTFKRSNFFEGIEGEQNSVIFTSSHTGLASQPQATSGSREAGKPAAATPRAAERGRAKPAQTAPATPRAADRGRTKPAVAASTKAADKTAVKAASKTPAKAPAKKTAKKTSTANGGASTKVAAKPATKAPAKKSSRKPSPVGRAKTAGAAGGRKATQPSA